ncbi:hypothetical protein PMAYCL1PPCAC_05152, partial [Pristionchus mayeri]
MEQLVDHTNINVPFLYPDLETIKDKSAISKLIGYAKGQFGANNFLTTFVAPDFKDPDNAPFLYYIDQPHPIFDAAVYTDDVYPVQMEGILCEIFATEVQMLHKFKCKIPEILYFQMMASDIVELDRIISTTMQQDSIVRRQAERNYNPHSVAELGVTADQIDWTTFLQSAMTRLGGNPLAVVDASWKVIIMEEEITLNALNELLEQTPASTIVNYVYYKTFSKIETDVPAPPV